MTAQTAEKTSKAPRRVYGEKLTNRMIHDYQCDDCQGRAFVEKGFVRVLHDPYGCPRFARLKREHPKMYGQRA